MVAKKLATAAKISSTMSIHALAATAIFSVKILPFYFHTLKQVKEQVELQKKKKKTFLKQVFRLYCDACLALSFFIA